MDIFDLSIDELEKKIDEILEGYTEEELLKELIDNGLVINEYDSESYYIGNNYNNTWVHTTRTSNKKRNNLLNNSLLEAA